MRVGILGSGASGLTAIKICLEYGFEPVCFEKSHDIGGLWRYKPQECDGEASVMKSTVINTSKEMMAYSDFPPSKEYPNFMHNSRVVDYFREYAERFHLLEHVRFHTLVLSVHRSPNHESTGQWIIKYKELQSEEDKEETFDAVLLCTGHHVEPYMAKFKGLDKFPGQVLHSHSYKSHVGYEDRRVVVIGVGNSGGDISVELSRVASQVYTVTRTGTWVFNRVGDFGYPLDALFNKRNIQWLKDRFPKIVGSITESLLNYRFDHANYGLKPNHGVFQAHVTINDDLPNRIACGRLIVKPNVREFKEDGSVEFEDGSRVEGVEVVIVCTGYSFGFPYLEEGLIPVHDNRTSLFKYMYSPQISHSSLAVIGLIQPLGAIMPISEMQCRLFCDVLSGGTTLPPKSAMEEDIELKSREMAERYVASRRHTIQVDYIPYMDQLAEMMGAKPEFWPTFKRDPRLAMALVFGPCAPYQYRLVGPHPWLPARDTLLTIWDRILFPTRTRAIKTPRKDGSFRTVVLVVVLYTICHFVEVNNYITLHYSCVTFYRVVFFECHFETVICDSLHTVM